MLDLETRQTILRLNREGHGKRTIARAVGVTRNSVRKVLADGSPEVPPLVRPQRLQAHLERLRKLHVECDGNLIRVHEKLNDDGIEIPYSVLTAFCRRSGIGHPQAVITSCRARRCNTTRHRIGSRWVV